MNEGLERISPIGHGNLQVSFKEPSKAFAVPVTV